MGFWELGKLYGPEMYCDRSSRPTAAAWGSSGFQSAVMRILVLRPGTTDTFCAVACPNIVLFLRSLMFMYGTVAE